MGIFLDIRRSIAFIVAARVLKYGEFDFARLAEKEGAQVIIGESKSAEFKETHSKQRSNRARKVQIQWDEYGRGGNQYNDRKGKF